MSSLYSAQVVVFLADKKQTLSNPCVCCCFSGLPNPALQALCKLITASETGEQLINRVSWEVFLQYQFPNGSSRSVDSEVQRMVYALVHQPIVLGDFRVVFV